MVNFVRLLQSALLAVVLVAVMETESAAEKLSECCKKVNRQEIDEPIIGYLVQRANPPCVPAIIFQTETGFYCSHVRAPWVRRKIVAFEKAKARATAASAAPSTTASLLSIITSTASPPSSSSFSPPSSSSFSPPSSSSSLPSTSSSSPLSSSLPSFSSSTSSE